MAAKTGIPPLNKALHWQKAGVTERIHDLRHTTGMRTLRKTGNLKTVQKLLGHSGIATTRGFFTPRPRSGICARRWKRRRRGTSSPLRPWPKRARGSDDGSG